MPRPGNNHTKKSRCARVARWLLILALAYRAIFPSVALAQPGVPQNTNILLDIPRVIEHVQDALDKTLGATATGALIQATSFFLRSLSYQAAKWITSGATGQKSLIEEKGIGQVLLDTAGDTLGDVVGNLSESLIGLNLCQFPDLRLAINFQISLRELYGHGTPKPSCDWQTLSNSWSKEAFENRFGQGAGRYILDRFNTNLSLKNSDFGIALNGLEKINRSLSNKNLQKQIELLQQRGGVKPLTDLISGNILTPTALVEQEIKQLSAEEQKTLTAEQLASIHNNANLRLILPQVLSTFLNTIASDLLKSILTKGVVSPQAARQYDANYFGELRRNERAAQTAFSSLLAPIIEYPQNYDVVRRYANCPDENEQLDNCVMDQRLQAALLRTVPLTVREAMGEGFLDKDKPIISYRNEVKNTDKNCWRGAYCYSNIQKLRKARIVPLGLEVAAFIADPARPPTLGEVVRGFNDPQSQFYHLVNPNWILKAPKSFCSMQGVGPNLVDSRGAERQTECMDLATCLHFGSDGRCLEEYGYCLKEKNIWRIGGDACEPQYNTCKTYGGPNGQASYLSRTVDYGECSADSVGCRAYSVEATVDAQGRRAWAATALASLASKSAGIGRNGAVRLNAEAARASCPENADGCTAFYPALRAADGSFIQQTPGAYRKDTRLSVLAHLKKAPEYLGCYDANPATPETDWPTTLADVRTRVSQNPACNSYAPVCVPEEVGCEAYTPVSGGPAIPAKAGANRCDAQCAGYDSFKQRDTSFEPEAFPVYLIPSRGQSCDPNYHGCDEFTNLDVAARGGEGLEYYTDLKYCEKPNTDAAGARNEKTFYSWQGSSAQGYSLQAHRLLRVDAQTAQYIAGLGLALPPGVPSFDAGDLFPEGSPVYDDDRKEALEGYLKRCNAVAYRNSVQTLGTGFLPDGTAVSPVADDDCRALYDDAGNVYYRILGHTVTVSENCHPLRKTIAQFERDAALTAQGAVACAGRGGWWDGSACQRCASGGRFVAPPAGSSSQGGFCLYQTISEEARSCPAAANGCRTYIGNTGGNRGIVFDDNFEPAGNDPQALLRANPAWQEYSGGGLYVTSTNVAVASEALRVSEHSLGINTDNAGRWVDPATIRRGTLYELTFWARSVAPQNVSIYLLKRAGGAAGAPLARTGTIGGAIGGLTRTPAPVRTIGGNPVIAEFTFDAVQRVPTRLTLGGGWREYRLGPVALADDPGAEARLVFEREGIVGGPSAGRYFIDQVRLTAVQDEVSLVKNSWRTSEGYNVPLVCDANPNDSYPGAALGCREYRDSDNQRIFTAGFEALCREKAVGCMPLYDTRNTVAGPDAERASAYNLRCVLPQAVQNPADCAITVGTGADQKQYKCAVPRGADGCFIREKVILPDGAAVSAAGILSPNISSNARADASTIIIPEDTPETEPVYLANQRPYRCSERERGCMLLGRETQLGPLPVAASAAEKAAYFSHEPAMVANNPDAYLSGPGGAGALCSAGAVGCARFGADSSEAYFKDPAISGAGVCSYRTVDGATGWFHDTLGHCNNDNSRLCSSDAQCGAGNSCIRRGSVACYQNFVRRTPGGVVYDIRSNKDAGYAGFVGACRPDQNACTELLDPADTAESVARGGAIRGAAYYVKYNDRLKSRQSECTGASLTEGCVLFDRTEDPNKLHNTELTYLESELQNFALTPPRPAPDPRRNNANIILKVDRDRTCSEWLACKTATIRYDQEGKARRLCSEYRPCILAKPGAGDDQCDVWAETGSAVGVLDKEEYASRDTSWYGRDYSGYSLYGQYQVGDMRYINFDMREYMAGMKTEAERTRMKEVMSVPHVAYAVAGDVARTACALPENQWGACAGGAGRCYNGQCLSPIAGKFPADTPTGLPPSNDLAAKARAVLSIVSAFEGGTCKAFPEKDSPFPRKLAIKAEVRPKDAKTGELTRETFSENKPGFEKANICQNGNCSCEYKKYIYGGVADYWPHDTASDKVPAGICSGGEKSNNPCRADADCPGGNCQPLDKKETRLGLRGFCLERDLSRPVNGLATGAADDPVQDYACLTWLPIQTSASNIDIYNTAVAAGYFPDIDARVDDKSRQIYGQVYCSAATQVAGMVNPGGRFLSDSGSVNGGEVGWWIRTYFNESSPPETVLPFFYKGGEEGVSRGVPITFPGPLPSVGHNVCATPYDLFAACNNLSSPAPAYRVMQAWAWEMLGRNAVVLRMERPGAQDFGIGRQAGFEFRDQSQSPGCAGDSCVDVFYFAPAFVRTTPMSAGTLVHPPRTWGDISRLAGLKSSLYYEPTPRPGFDSYHMSAPAYSAEATTFFGGSGGVTADASLLLAPGFERTIREADISRIYFVPTAFPDGANGVMPNPLNTKLYMDFSKINRSPTLSDNGKDENRTVQSFFVSSAGSTASGMIVPALTPNDNRDGSYGGLLTAQPGAHRQAATGYVWSYKLVRTDDAVTANGLVSFDSYPVSSGDIQYYESPVAGDAGPLYDSTGKSRNQIASRYVLAYLSKWDGQSWRGDGPLAQFPNFVPVDPTSINQAFPPNRPPDSVGSDPFSAECNQSSDNWFAIGMDFNRDGEFLGYISRWCNATRTGAGGIQFSVIATLNDQCTEFAQVYDDSSFSDITNKAWTNRVWRNAMSRVGNNPVPRAHPVFGDPFRRTAPGQPFGSLPLLGSAILPTSRITAESGIALRNSTFRYSSYDNNAPASGAPAVCAEPQWNGFSIISPANNASDCSSLAGLRSYPYDNALVGSLNAYNPQGAGGDGGFVLSKLFAKTFLKNMLDPSSPALYSAGGDLDVSGGNYSASIVPMLDNGQALDHPRIYSLNPLKCPEGDRYKQGECAAAEEDNFTVNGKNQIPTADYNGDTAPEEDANGDGRPDPIVAVGSYKAHLRFFASADDNRMPIRQVAVNWGDALLPEIKSGFYQNRKPYCDPDDGPDKTVGLCGSAGNLSMISCRTDDDCKFLLPGGVIYDCYGSKLAAGQSERARQNYTVARFGNKARACKAEPFAFEHNYSCKQADLRASPQPPWVRNVSDRNAWTQDQLDSLRADGVTSGKVCVFRPRVQVRDNWGWCTGQCSGGGCYGLDLSDRGSCDRPEAWVPFGGFSGASVRAGEIIVVPAD